MSSFNIGFLRAVKGSIVDSLSSAEKKTQAVSAESLASFDAHLDLHKAIGAMRMIGLEGCNTICLEMEKLASAIHDGSVDVSAGRPALIDSLAVLKRYLDDLLDGAKDVPARMFVQYQAIKIVLNSQPATPMDLFFPTFDADVKNQGDALAAPVLEKLVKSERPKFQAALVKWMKDASNPAVINESVVQMQGVVDVLGSVGGRKSYSLFWLASGAFLGLLPNINTDVQRSEFRAVISKLDIEMRKFAEGMKKPSDETFRSMLFHIAQASDSVEARVQHVRGLFSLDAYWNEVQHGIKESQSPLHLVNTDEIKEILGQAKTELLKVASGADTDKFKKLCTVLATKIADFKNPAVKKLSDSVLFVAQKVASKDLRLTDMIAEEVAFIFVLLDGLVEKRGRTSPDFDKQVDFEIKRLSAALKNQADVIQQLQSPELDEQSKRENEHGLIRHTVSEIKADLSQVEELLDTFFRSNGENRDELVDLRKPLRSAIGAVRILGLKDAAKILGEVVILIEALISGDVPTPNELEKITDGIGGISLYLEAFQDGAEPGKIIDPLMVLFFGTASSNTVVAEKPMEIIDVEIQQPVQNASVDIGPQVESVAIVDAGLEDAAIAAKASGLTAPVEMIEVAGPADIVETVGAWDKPSDDELAEVYLEETSEIFDTISTTLSICEAKPHDKEALTTLRRAFHTLKGSGRMVGLTEMGEAAWIVEHFLNKWLSEDRPVTRQILDIVVHATSCFKGWVSELRTHNKVLVNYESISAKLDAMNKPHDQTGVPTPVVVAPIVPAHAVFDITAAEPVAEVGAEPVAEVAAEPVAEVAAEPVAEVGAEPVAEVGAEPVAEVAAEPVAEVAASYAVTFGDLEISRTLFDIFCAESGDRLKDIEEALILMKESSSGEVQETLVRSAHTFGSIGRTVGFPHVSELGYEIEQWAQDKVLHGEGASVGEIELIEGAIDDIRGMVNSIRVGNVPAGDNGRVGMLRLAVENAKASRSIGVPDHSTDADEQSAVIAPNYADLEPNDLNTSVQLVSAGQESESASCDEGVGSSESVEMWELAIAGAIQDIEAIREHLASLQQGLLGLAKGVSEGNLSALKKNFDGFNPLASPREVLAALLERHFIEISKAVEPIAKTFLRAAPLPRRSDLSSALKNVSCVAEPVAEVAAEPVAEVAAELVAEVAAEPVAEVAAEPVVEVAEEPVVEEFDLGLSLGLEIGQALAPSIDAGLDLTKEEGDVSELDEQLASIEDDLDESLLSVFVEEAQELVPQIGQMIIDLRSAPNDTKLIHSLHRALHTVKGSARMVGALRVGGLVHHMESMMESAANGKIAAIDIVDVLESQYDRMSAMLEATLHPELQAKAETHEPAINQEDAVGIDIIADSQVVNAVQKVVRVGTDTVDRLVNEAGEVRLSGAALSGNMDVMRRSLHDLGENAKRLSKMLRELELQTETQMAARKAAAEDVGESFDPLEFDRFTRAQELSRFLAEGMHDIIDVQVNLDRLVINQDSVIVHQDQMAADIQQTLMSVRLVKFDTISARLFKVVRQTSKDVGKKILLDILGGNVEVDRGVLDRMVAPLEHLLRNGVAHGIEMPEARKLNGKPESGLITLEVLHEGSFVRMRMTDDGQGLNAEAVRKKGVEKGLLGVNEKPSDERLIELIFMPGFSTADAVSQIAGRGVGMDVVKNEIVSLGGHVEVKSVQGKGMVYNIVLPVSLATTQAILVEASGQLWAIPAEMVDVINSFKMPQVQSIQKDGFVKIDDVNYPYAYLPHLLGETSMSPEHKTYNTIVMARSGEKRIAVHVDRLLGTREIVVKNIGRQMARISGISGATVMGDGRLGIIINPVYLANNRKDGGNFFANNSLLDKVVRVSRPTVMVVDDSLTIRKATSKLLERSGYDVMIAKDGIDALEVLQERLPDVILSDVEMPRMDGFELLKNLKAEPKYQQIPVIMITSRTADRHKSTGLSLGAQVYLGKPYKEDELIGHIEFFIKAKVVA